MPNRSMFRFGVLLMVVALLVPNPAAAQEGQQVGPLSRSVINTPVPASVLSQRLAYATRDSLANGILIGAGVGALVGLIVVPRAYCGNDPECAGIVSLLIGLPIVGGGAAVGAIVDAANERDSRPAGLGIKVRW